MAFNESSEEDFFMDTPTAEKLESGDVHVVSEVVKREALRLLGSLPDSDRDRAKPGPSCTATSVNAHLGEAAHVPEPSSSKPHSGEGEGAGQADITASQFDELFNGDDPFLPPVQRAPEPVVSPGLKKGGQPRKRKRRQQQNEDQPTKWPRHLLADFPHIRDPPGAKKNSHVYERNPDFERYWHNATHGYGKN